MRRREFITLLGSVAAWPIAARAQQPDRMRLIGVLIAYAQNNSTAQSWLAAFRAALATLGWTEGSNLRMELRWSAADADVMRKLAKELVDLRPNAIFGVTTPAIGALARETTTIPTCSRAYPIRSAAASLRTLRIRAATSPASRPVTPIDTRRKMGRTIKADRSAHRACGIAVRSTTVVPVQFFMPWFRAAASSFAVQVSAAPVHGKDETKALSRHKHAIQVAASS